MLTLQYIPQHQLANLSTDEKIKKLLRSVREDKIIIVEGKLNPFEETQLIQKTMEMISRNFKGIEISTIDYKNKNIQLLTKIKTHIAQMLLGISKGLTIIGPATIVKEIKKDPNKIELLTKDIRFKKNKTKPKLNQINNRNNK